MGASLFQKLIDMVSIKYQSLSKHPDKPIVVPISNNSEKRKAVKIQYQSTSTFKKNNNTNILLMPLKAMIAKTNNIQILQKTATNQYPAYALKSDDSKNQQYPNPTENNNKPILLQYARVAWHVRPEKTEAGKLFYL